MDIDKIFHKWRYALFIIGNILVVFIQISPPFFSTKVDRVLYPYYVNEATFVATIGAALIALILCILSFLLIDRKNRFANLSFFIIAGFWAYTVYKHLTKLGGEGTPITSGISLSLIAIVLIVVIWGIYSSVKKMVSIIKRSKNKLDKINLETETLIPLELKEAFENAVKANGSNDPIEKAEQIRLALDNLQSIQDHLENTKERLSRIAKFRTLEKPLNV